jgi:hypothetical protein
MESQKAVKLACSDEEERMDSGMPRKWPRSLSTPNPFPICCGTYAIAREIGEKCGAIVIVDDDAHQQALKKYISP